jgi:hypothetical protein
MSESSTLSGEHLEAVVRAVPGVSGLYSAAPILAQAVGELPLAATTRPGLIHVDAAADPPSVTASIGVDPSARAPEVAGLVAAAIHAEAGPGWNVSVRVSRVSG